MKTTKFFNHEDRKWVVVDAKDRILGRLSTRIAKILQGKTKATYSPNFMCGDKVIIINAKHIRVTGNKYADKIYDKYSGYPSGLKKLNLKGMMEKNPSRVLYLAVKGMLPRNHLGRMMLKSLKIYAQGQHQQQAQKPDMVNI